MEPGQGTKASMGTKKPKRLLTAKKHDQICISKGSPWCPSNGQREKRHSQDWRGQNLPYNTLLRTVVKMWKRDDTQPEDLFFKPSL